MLLVKSSYCPLIWDGSSACDFQGVGNEFPLPTEVTELSMRQINRRISYLVGGIPTEVTFKDRRPEAYVTS